MAKRKYKTPPLTAEQQALVEGYLSDNYAKAKKCIHIVLKRRVSSQNMEDYMGIAHLALIKAARRFRPDKRMTFTSFANMNICSAIKTELTRENRDCRQFNKTAQSLEAPVKNDDNLRIMDIIVGDSEINIEETHRIQQYLNTLPEDAKKVLSLRCEGYDYIKIRDNMGYTTKQMKDVLMKIQKPERVNILYKE